MAQTLVAGACSWASSPLIAVGRTRTELGYKPQGDGLPPGSLYLLKVSQSLKTAPPTGVGSGWVQTHAYWDIWHTNQNRPGAEAAYYDPGSCLSIGSLPCYPGTFLTGAEYLSWSSRSSWWQTKPQGVLSKGRWGCPAVQSTLPLLPLVPKLYGENFSMLSHFLLYLRDHWKKYRT